MTISVAAGSDSSLGIGALGDVRPLRGQRHHQATLPQILNSPPHRADSHTGLLRHLPLALQPRTRQQLAGLDTARDPVGHLLPRIHRPGRIDDRLLITHRWNVESRTAPRPRR